METKKTKGKKQFRGIKNAFLVIIVCFIVAVCVFNFVFGNPANFMDGDPTGCLLYTSNINTMKRTILQGGL